MNLMLQVFALGAFFALGFFSARKFGRLTKPGDDCGSGSPSATLADLEERFDSLIMKASELPTELSALKAQVVKVFGEQQTRYDALVVAFDELKGTLENAELPAETTVAIADFHTLLQGFDDQIPDTTPEPPPTA